MVPIVYETLWSTRLAGRPDSPSRLPDNSDPIAPPQQFSTPSVSNRDGQHQHGGVHSVAQMIERTDSLLGELTSVDHPSPPPVAPWCPDPGGLDLAPPAYPQLPDVLVGAGDGCHGQRIVGEIRRPAALSEPHDEAPGVLKGRPVSVSDSTLHHGPASVITGGRRCALVSGKPAESVQEPTGTLCGGQPMVGADDPPIVDLPPPPVDGMPPLVLHEILSKVVAWQSPTPSPPEFRFEWSPAARHNLLVLRKYHMDLDAAIRAQPFSTLTPGSEFCPITAWWCTKPKPVE